MRQGRLQLVTPVPGSERWPLGYRIVGQRFFRTPDEFREGLQSIIDEHMLESPPPNLPIRFRGDLQYEAGNRYFHLRSRNIEHRVLDEVVPISVGHLIACGNWTASELIMRVTTDGASALAVADLLDQLYAAGQLIFLAAAFLTASAHSRSRLSCPSRKRSRISSNPLSAAACSRRILFPGATARSNPLPHPQDIATGRERFAFGIVQCPTMSGRQCSSVISITLRLNGFIIWHGTCAVIRRHVAYQGEIVP